MGRHHLQGKLQTKHNNMNLLILLLCLNIAIFNSCGQETQLSQIFEPPAGQRCRGRNFGERRCCTPGDPCDEGEGDCDGPGDGGNNDGHAGCKGDLVCGSNNCLQFGAYYHEKDDCCERPLVQSAVPLEPPASSSGWGPWSNWTPCMRVHQQISGRCRKTKTRKCVSNECGSSLQHTEELQEQYCQETDC